MYVCYPIAITICIKIGYVHVKKLILNKKKRIYYFLIHTHFFYYSKRSHLKDHTIIDVKVIIFYYGIAPEL